MSTSPRRGRRVQVEKRSSSSRTRALYLIAAVVVVIGVAAAIAYTAGSGTTSDASVALGDPAEAAENGLFFLGDEDAPVTVIEYADFQCPACANFVTSDFYQRFKSEYVDSGQVQYFFHDFPLPQHPRSLGASQAARCAGDQGQFWPMHDIIYIRQTDWSGLGEQGARDRLKAYAAELGLEEAAFNACLDSNTYEERVLELRQAANTANIPATPTFVVNGQQVTASQLPLAIDAALAAQGNEPAGE